MDRTIRSHMSPRIALAVFRRDSFTCAACGIAGGDLTVDHIVPVTRGGTNDPDNLRTMCRSCNARKNDRLDGEYVAITLCYECHERPALEPGGYAPCAECDGAERARIRAEYLQPERPPELTDLP